jgi:hypothetical protein
MSSRRRLRAVPNPPDNYGDPSSDTRRGDGREAPATCTGCGSAIDPQDPDGSPTSCPPCRQGSLSDAPLNEVERAVYQGGLAFVPLTATQLGQLAEAVGSHAGALIDGSPDPRAYVPFANLQSYLQRFKDAATTPPPDHPITDREAAAILQLILEAQGVK